MPGGGHYRCIARICMWLSFQRLLHSYFESQIGRLQYVLRDRSGNRFLDISKHREMTYFLATVIIPFDDSSNTSHKLFCYSQSI